MRIFGWKSSSERLYEALQEERVAAREVQLEQMKVMAALVEATGRQAQAVESYFKFFTEGPQTLPQIRVMNDVDELGVEERIRQKRVHEDRVLEGKIPVIAPDDWMRDVSRALDSYQE